MYEGPRWFTRYSEKRFRVYHLTAETLIEMFNLHINHDVIARMEIEGLPEGSEVACVQANFNPHGIEAIVWNKAFDIVPDGEHIPRNPGSFSGKRCVLLSRQKDGTFKDGDGATWRSRESLL